MPMTIAFAAGAAIKNFSDSRGLLLLTDFLTHGNAIMDLVLYVYQGSINHFHLGSSGLICNCFSVYFCFVILSPPFH